MNQNDQRLYKILIYGGYAHLLRDGRHVNDNISHLLGLSRSLFCDYMDFSQDMFNLTNHEMIGRISDMLEIETAKRNFDLNGYIVCGLAVRECIDGDKRSKTV